MEFDNWLTLERIAYSDFMAVVFEGVKSGSWEADEALDLAVSALWTFGNGNCYFLASAVADATGGTVAGFWRRSGDDRLVHAFVVDPADGHGFDILGRRPVSEIRQELEVAVGGLRMSVLPSIRPEMDDVEVECLLDIAAGLPWMRVDRPQPDKMEWASLVRGYADARMKNGLFDG